MKNNLPFKQGFLLVLMLLSIGVFSGFSQTAGGIQQGKVQVKFKPTMSATLGVSTAYSQNGIAQLGITSFDAVATQYNAIEIKPMFIAKPGREEAHRRHGLHLWYEVTIDYNANILSSVSDFGGIAEVEMAEPVYAKSIIGNPEFTKVSLPFEEGTTTFTDPGLTQQWHYENDGSENGVVEADINLYEAWQTTTGSSNVIVSVHDSGVDVGHEDLAANMWVNEAELNGEPGVDDDFNGYIDDINGYDFIDNRGDIFPGDHGTHVSGTVAAVNNNGVGVGGVAGGSGSGDGTRIMAIRTIGGAANVASTFVYAADNGAIISQNSWSYNTPGAFEQAVLDAIDYFIAEAGYYEGSPMKGGIVIFAASNDDYDRMVYPAYYQNVMAVSALGRSNKKAFYSNFGAWVDIAAPGGDMTAEYGGSAGGVLSTLPNNNYGFNQGTSMACPHVSGVAALVVANNGGDNFTNDNLWTHLITATHDIDQYNPGYEGLLGVGYLDAALAVSNNAGIAPDKASDFTVNLISQDFVDLMWTTVGDSDDGTVFGYEIYHGTDSTDVAENNNIKSNIIANATAPGAELTYSVFDLIPETKYYFGISAFDRWGNRAEISTVVSATTTDAPEIAFDKSTITFTIDVSVSDAASDVFNVVNNEEGALKWRTEVRQTKKYRLSTSSVVYPTAPVNTPSGNIVMTEVTAAEFGIGTDDYINGYVTKKWRQGLSTGTRFMIGEEDLALPNSSATRFQVSDPDGFNLTRVNELLRQNSNIDPDAVIEIYVGEAIEKKNLVHAQNFTVRRDYFEINKSIFLYGDNYGDTREQQQIFLEQGEVFWVVTHMPAGIQYPLGIGQEEFPGQSDNCYISSDLGKTWIPLAEAINDDRWVWYQELQAAIQPLHEYITLSPPEGVTPGLDQHEITVDVDASALINGKYYAQATFYSNDSDTPVADVDFTVNISGHQPALNSETLVDFGSTFVGIPTTLDIQLNNPGLGVFKFVDASCTSTNPDFDLGGTSKKGIPTRINALDSDDLTVVFTPSVSGNVTSVITLVDAKGNNHIINVSGVGISPSEVALNPATVSFDAMTIGDVQQGSFEIVNNGDYPLQYALPRYDDEEVTVSTPSGNPFAYTWETSNDPGATIVYSWEDISATGLDITSHWESVSTIFYGVDLGFQFPMFNQVYDKLYITKYGLLTPHTEIGVVGNLIRPGNTFENAPISGLNKRMLLDNGGNIYVQRKAGRLIVQYEDVRLSSSISGHITFQTIIYANGNVVHNYKEVPTSAFTTKGIAIALEDPDKIHGFVAYDGSSSNDAPPAGLVNESSVIIISPGISAMENYSATSGIIPVGQSETITFDVNSSNLAEGDWSQRIVVASNDPISPYISFTSMIEVNAGGTENIELAESDIDMGTIFQGDSTGAIIEIRNTGNKAVIINSATLDNDNFELVGDEFPFELASNTTFFMPVGHDGVAQGDFTDVLTFDLSNGTTETVNLEISIGPAPQISISTDPIDYALNVGESIGHTVTIQNSSAVELEYSIAGTEWAYFNDDAVAPDAVQLPDTDYIVRNSIDDASVSYAWEGLPTSGGEQLADATQVGEWSIKELPFEFQYYGNTYDKIYINQLGFISFTDHTDLEFGFGSFQVVMPDPILANNVIAPYWSDGIYYYYGDDVEKNKTTGAFYKEYDDRVIIEFSGIGDRFGFTTPLAAQAIIYKNGNIKFQYNDLDGQLPAFNRAVIGIENEDASAGEFITGFTNYIVHGTSIVFSPAHKRTLAASASVTLDMTVDATQIIGGTYTEDLVIQSNVPGSEVSTVPMTLTVTGIPVLDIPSEVDFGDALALELPNGDIETYTHEFLVSNLGTDVLTITTAELAQGVVDFDVNMVTEVCFRGRCIEVLIPFEGAIDMVLNPGEKAEVRVELITMLANYEAKDTIIFDAGLASEVRIPLYANVYLPAVLSIDQNAFLFEADDRSYTDSGTITFDNTTGNSDLEYSAELTYNRTGTSMATATKNNQYQFGEIVSIASTQEDTSTGTDANTTFNRELSHLITEDPETYIGFGEVAFTSATRFRADDAGFNLSHVSTYYSSEALSSSRLVAEIYAGQEIADAVFISTSEFIHESSADFKGWVEIPLAEAFLVSPFETFWVVIRYPVGTSFPQAINDVGDLTNTFMFPSGGFWNDLQEAGFEGKAWMVKAQEETFVESAWIELEAFSGIVPTGESGTLSFDISALSVEESDVSATIIISSNDPHNPTEEVAVDLHLNQGPVFDNPQTSYTMNELETIEFSLVASDIEGESFTFALAGEPTGMSLADMGDGEAVVTFTADYYAAGMYSFDVEATDVMGNVDPLTITLEVINMNRATTSIAMADLELNVDNSNYTIASADVFSDEDIDDVLEFRAIATDGSIATVYASDQDFIIIPQAEGTTMVTLYGTDNLSAEVSQTFTLTVIGEANTAPSSQVMNDLNLSIGDGEHAINVSSVFTDDDGDALFYRVEIDDATIAEVTSSNTAFGITPLSQGQAMVTLFATDGIHSEVSVSFMVTAEFVLSVGDDISASQMSLYPNPVLDQLTVTVETPGEYQVRLVNIVGKVFYNDSVKIENNTVIDMRNIPNGTYIVELIGENTSLKQRIIKQ